MRSTKNLLMALVAAAVFACSGIVAAERDEAFDAQAVRSTGTAGSRVVDGGSAVSGTLAASALSLDRQDSSGGGAANTSPAAPVTSQAAGSASAQPATEPEPAQASSTIDPSALLTMGSSGLFAGSDTSKGASDSDEEEASDSGESDSKGKAGADAKAKRAKDGGLDVPRINQNTGGGRYPKAYCGPTSVRMVLAYFGIRINADTAAKGVYIKGKGASHEGMAKKLRSYGVKASLSRTKSLASLKEAVGRGHPVIVNVRGDYGPRRTGGHIIVVVGFDKSGNPIINDPAGGGRHVCPRRKFANAWNGLMIEASK